MLHFRFHFQNKAMDTQIRPTRKLHPGPHNTQQWQKPQRTLKEIKINMMTKNGQQIMTDL